MTNGSGPHIKPKKKLPSRKKKMVPPKTPAKVWATAAIQKAVNR